jgi:hypothetical protein
MARRVAIDHFLENIADVAVGFDTIELGGLDQRGDGRPACATAVRRDLMMPGF